jgi:RimJ/RimL family protein N-acetyltransferase
MAEASDALTTAPCELLEWDSEHFGFPVAQVIPTELTEEAAAAADQWCRDAGVRCLYLCTDVADAASARIAAGSGFRVVDARVIARRPHEGLLDLAPGPSELTGRQATESDLAFARDLAARSHRTSRFYFDGNFPRDRCDALDEAWVERAHRDPERRLLIGVVEGEPVGYLAGAPLDADGEANGELVAIEERHRGKGFGLALHFVYYRDLGERGARSQRAAMSLRNLANIRLHERLGYVTDTAEVWHHKWYGDSGVR